MAKKKPTAATAGAAIKPDATYEVKLSRPVKHGPTVLRPTDARIRLLGSVVLELGDAVELYREV
ncbi:MAG: hypothetical protein ACK4TP_11200 [Hyphomicrobium sp.]